MPISFYPLIMLFNNELHNIYLISNYKRNRSEMIINHCVVKNC